MNATIVACIAIGAVVILGLIGNAFAAWIWVKTIAEANRIASFRQGKALERDTAQMGVEAADDLAARISLTGPGTPPPTDAEIRELILARRNGHATPKTDVVDTTADEEQPFGGTEYHNT